MRPSAAPPRRPCSAARETECLTTLTRYSLEIAQLNETVPRRRRSGLEFASLPGAQFTVFAAPLAARGAPSGRALRSQGDGRRDQGGRFYPTAAAGGEGEEGEKGGEGGEGEEGEGGGGVRDGGGGAANRDPAMRPISPDNEQDSLISQRSMRTEDARNPHALSAVFSDRRFRRRAVYRREVCGLMELADAPMAPLHQIPATKRSASVSAGDRYYHLLPSPSSPVAPQPHRRVEHGATPAGRLATASANAPALANARANAPANRVLAESKNGGGGGGGGGNRRHREQEFRGPHVLDSSMAKPSSLPVVAGMRSPSLPTNAHRRIPPIVDPSSLAPSPSPFRGPSPAPSLAPSLARSPSPFLARSPSPALARPPSPFLARSRSPSPSRARSPSPSLARSPSPALSRSPSTTRPTLSSTQPSVATSFIYPRKPMSAPAESLQGTARVGAVVARTRYLRLVAHTLVCHRRRKNSTVIWKEPLAGCEVRHVFGQAKLTVVLAAGRVIYLRFGGEKAATMWLNALREAAKEVRGPVNMRPANFRHSLE